MVRNISMICKTLGIVIAAGWAITDGAPRWVLGLSIILQTVAWYMLDFYYERELRKAANALQ